MCTRFASPSRSPNRSPTRLPLPAAAVALLAATALCALAPAAQATDAHGGATAQPAAHGSAPAEAARPAAKPAPASPSPAEAPKAAAQAPAAEAPHPPARASVAADDSLDRLRERLAEKLGAVRAPSPNVLRVVNRAASPRYEARAAPAATRLAPAASGHGPGPGHIAEGRTLSSVAYRDGLVVETAAPTHVAHWNYQGGGGPDAWAQIKPEFAKCSTGTRQSPIDIRDGVRVQLDPVQFDYKPSAFRVVDNGHTVQVNVAGGNSIEVLGRRFDLVQFHFHRPSEERINGRQFDMVAHLVHKDIDGRLAVVAVLLDRGSVQPLVQTVWNNLPLEKGEEVAAQTAIDLNRLLPDDRAYYTYMGSLTTPPCSEGVLWMVMKQPVPVSNEQIAIFARLYPMNARPIQHAGGRLIKESN